MSEVIDSSVVELYLDNSNFEKNVKKSIDLLDQFKGAVANASNFTSEAGKQMAEGLGEFAKSGFSKKTQEQMDDIQQAAKQVTSLFTVWGQTVQDLRKKMAKLISNELTLIPRTLTKTAKLVTSLIKSGGLSRALNLERAQFQMNGLGISWKKALADINYGVQDTAYGLDSAARAASQLSASGVKLGDDMKAALRGISGVAAMTSASYDEIAYVFTSIAGMGRATAQQLNRLSIRGINAFATLAKYLHKTQAEVRDMVSKGEIDFDTFAKAMDSAFGEHAKDANKTFEGALSNVKAALSRIGAEIAAPYYDAARDVLNALRLTINSIKKELDPTLKAIGGSITIMGQQITKFIEGITIPKGAFSDIENFVKRFNAYLSSDAFKQFKSTILGIFNDVGDVVHRIGEWIGEVVFLVKPAFDQAAGFAGDLFTIVSKTVHHIFNNIVKTVMALSPIIEPLAWGFADAIGIVSKTVNILNVDLLSIGKSIRSLADPIAEVIKPLAGPLYKSIVTIGQVISNIIGHLSDTFNALLPAVTPVIKILSGQFKIWLLGIERFWNYVSLIVTAVSNNIAPVIKKAAEVLDKLGNFVWNLAGGIESLFIAVWKAVFGPLKSTIEFASHEIVGIFDIFSKGIDAIEPLIKSVLQSIAYGLGFTVGTLKNIFGAAEPLVKYLDNQFGWLNNVLKGALVLATLLSIKLKSIFGGSIITGLFSLGPVKLAIKGIKLALIGLTAWMAGAFAIGNFVKIDEIKKAFGIAGKTATDTGKEIVEVFDGVDKSIGESSAGMIGIFKGSWKNLGDIAESVASGIANSFSGLQTKIAGIGKTIFDGIFGVNVSAATLYDEETMKMIESSGYTVEGAVKESAEKVEGAVKESGEEAQKAATESIKETGKVVETQTTNTFGNVFSTLREKVIPAIKKFFGSFDKETIGSVVDTLERLTPIITSVLIMKGVTRVFKPLKGIFKPFEGIFKPLENILKPLENVATSLKDAKLGITIKTGLEDSIKEIIKIGKNINKNVKANAFVSYSKGFLLMASSVAVLTGAIVMLGNTVDTQKVEALAPMLTLMIGGIAVLAKAIGSISFSKVTYQMSALDKLAAPMKSVLSSLKNTIDQVKINSFLTAFAGSVAILAVSLARFNKIDWETAIKGVMMYGSFLSELVVAEVILKRFKIDSFGKFSLSFSASVGVLGFGIKTFNDVDWFDALNAMRIFGSFLATLAGYGLGTKLLKVDKLTSFSLGFSVAVPLLSLGVRSFAGIKFTDALPMLSICGTFFAELAIISAAINDRKATFMNTIYTLLTMGEMFAIMEGLAVTISLMTVLDQDKLMGVAAPLAMVGTVFAGMEVGSLALHRAKLSGILLMITALGEVMYGLYYLTTTLDDDQVERFDTIATAISKALAVVGLAEIFFAVAGSFGFGAVTLGTVAVLAISGIVALAASLAGLIASKYPELAALADQGLPMIVTVFESIGDAMGAINSGLIGGLGAGAGKAVGGYKAGVMESQFKGIEEFLGGTSDSVANFAQMVNGNITDDTISKMSRFGGALQDFVKAGDKKESFKNLRDELGQVASVLPPFAAIMSGMTDEQRKAIEDTSTTITLLGQAIEAIPTTSKVSEWFTGIHDVEQFGQNLGYLARGLMTYYASLTTGPNGEKVTIDTNLISNSANAAKALAELNANLPKTGGALQEFLGQQNLLAFSTSLGSLGHGIAAYQKAFSGMTFDENLVKKSASAAMSLAALNNALPKTGGVFQDFFGEQDMGVFGEHLKTFGTKFIEFYNIVKDFEGSTAIEKIAAIGTTYAELENSLPPQDGVLYKFIFGEKNLGDFGARLVQYASSLVTYQSELAKVDFTKLSGGTAFLEGLQKLFIADIDTTTNFEQLQTISYYIHTIIMEITDELTKDKNVEDLQNAGTLLLTTMLSGIDSDKAKTVAGLKLDAVLKLVSDSLAYNQTLEKENFGDKLLSKMSSAITVALEKDTKIALAAGAILAKLKKAFEDLDSTLSTVGDNISKGLAAGMQTLAAKARVLRAGVVLGKAAISGIRKGADTHSPSRAAYEVGELIGEGLDLGFTSYTDTVFSSAANLGETAIQGLNSGIETAVKKQDPYEYLARTLGGDDSLISLAMISTMKTKPENYEGFATALLGLRNGFNFADFEAISRLYGSNPMKLAKVMYDQMYSGWKDKTDGPREYKNWKELYSAIVGGAISGEQVISALMTKFGVEFENSSYLLEDFNALFEETNGQVNSLVDEINVRLIKTLGNLERKYQGLHDVVGADFNKVAEEVQQAQLDFMAMQNDPNATQADLDLAYRRLTILQGSLDSLDKQHEYLDKQHEQEKKLAELEAENNKKRISENNSRKSSTDALGFSASDTSSKLEDMEDELDDSADKFGDLDDAAGNALDGLMDYKDDFARTGYELADAFQDDGWWKSFLDGSDSALAGYDLGSILAGNTISGLDGAANLFGDEGWDLGKYFTEGLNDALFGSSDTGILGSFKRLVAAAQDGTLSFKMIIEEGINTILHYLGLQADGVSFSFDNLLTTLKNKAVEFLNGLGIDLEGLANNISNFLGSLGIDTSAIQQKWTEIKSGAGSLLGNVWNGITSIFGGSDNSNLNPSDITIFDTAGNAIPNASDVVIIEDNKVDPNEVVVIDPEKSSTYQIPTISEMATAVGNWASQGYDALTGWATSLFSPNKKTASITDNANSAFNSYNNANVATKSGTASTSSSNNSDVVVVLKDLDNRVKGLQSDIRETQLVLDTGVVAGGVARDVRADIDNMVVLEGRGI